MTLKKRSEKKEKSFIKILLVCALEKFFFLYIVFYFFAGFSCIFRIFSPLLKQTVLINVFPCAFFSRSEKKKCGLKNVR